MTNSKQKGARFERTLASLFREYGFADSRRTAQYCGKSGDASDVIGLPGIHVEAKHREKMYLYDWIAQAMRDAKANGRGDLPAVFHKKNRSEILVTMTFDDWMVLYREYLSGMILDERGKADGDNKGAFGGCDLSSERAKRAGRIDPQI